MTQGFKYRSLKTWKVMEFIVTNFQTWKVIESLGKKNSTLFGKQKSKKKKIKSNR